MSRQIDLRSDTSTLPTPEMLRAISKAKLGNDGFGEDPSANELEAFAATMLGKEASLFVPSGTMGNLIALLTHLKRSESFIAGARAHIITREEGYSEFLQATPVQILDNRGMVTLDALRRLLDFKKATGQQPVRLVTYENTHADSGGTVSSVKDSAEIYDCARNHDLQVHLDGSRIFNASVALRVNVKDLARSSDSLMFCLSKGLAAPVGSLILGSRGFVETARAQRRNLGGQMRQVGILAAAGLWALQNMVARLEEDHKNAALLSKGLRDLSGDLKINQNIVESNIVLVGVTNPGLDAMKVAALLEKRGIRVAPRSEREFRCVTHKDISEEDIYHVLNALKEIANG
ncbi:MAG: beta-eliminating lyase-related protein [Thaumarchaeota archaeon]|nr:beta-eliminating lyase-related protein [Nitrososphaerota archaeon]